MKQIKLTQGQVALVDDEDFEWLSKHNWLAQWNKCTQSFYAYRTAYKAGGKRIRIYMAREIVGLNLGDKKQSDHINHDTLDNRRCNLRAVTQQQNFFNQKAAKGYYWNKENKKFMARIGLNGKHIYLGLFKTAKEARQAYLKAKKKYHKIETQGSAKCHKVVSC